jgi:hypothetical protein
MNDYCSEAAEFAYFGSENGDLSGQEGALDGAYCPCSTLSSLGEDSACGLDAIDRHLLVKLAACDKTEPAVLDKLAESHWVQVRSVVADNPRTLIFTLLKLAYDVDADVRYRLAENRRTPKQILQVLQKDENTLVSYRADLTMCRLSG